MTFCIAPFTSHCTKGNCDEVPLTKALKCRVKIIIISIHPLLLYSDVNARVEECRSLRFMGGINQLKRFRAFAAFMQTIRNKLAKAKDAHALCNNLGEFFLRNLKERPGKESC